MIEATKIQPSSFRNATLSHYSNDSPSAVKCHAASIPVSLQLLAARTARFSRGQRAFERSETAVGVEQNLTPVNWRGPAESGYASRFGERAMDLEDWDRLGIDDSKQSGSTDKAAGTSKPVAALVNDYRTKRNAWLAEVEHLAQMRDHVRSSAERETLEILAKARQDARNAIAAARRELLVLSEQVRAALGDTDPVPAAESRPDTTGQGQVVLAETSTAGLSTSVVLDTNPRRETPKRDDAWADLESLMKETESSKF
jgi:hypothetical protein